MRMKYFSEDEQYINAECENCKKVLKIKRNNCIRTDNGYKLNPNVKCFCNNIAETIIGKADIKASLNIPKRPTNTPKCPTCNSANIQKISLERKGCLLALFGIFAIGTVGKTFKCNNCGYQW